MDLFESCAFSNLRREAPNRKTCVNQGLSGKNQWAALWLASFRRLGLLARLAEAAGATTASIRRAANRMRV